MVISQVRAGLQGSKCCEDGSQTIVAVRNVKEAIKVWIRGCLTSREPYLARLD